MSVQSQLARQLRQQMKSEKLKNDMKGEGMYIFENNSKGDLFLPRPTSSGRKMVKKGEQFMGDNYYFGMLRTNELKLIKEVESPQTLLTEQPPTVTSAGQVEFVQVQERIQDEPQLLTEAPVDGIKILR